MIEDGSEAALHGAGGHDAEDVPGAGGDVPHCQTSPAVSRAGCAARLTQAGTELVRLRPGGAWLSSTDTGRQDGALDTVWSTLIGRGSTRLGSHWSRVS